MRASSALARLAALVAFAGLCLLAGLAACIADVRRSRAWWTSVALALAATAADATEYFCIPSDRVVEVGTQVLV